MRVWMFVRTCSQYITRRCRPTRRIKQLKRLLLSTTSHNTLGRPVFVFLQHPFCDLSVYLICRHLSCVISRQVVTMDVRSRRPSLCSIAALSAVCLSVCLSLCSLVSLMVVYCDQTTVSTLWLLLLLII